MSSSNDQRLLLASNLRERRRFDEASQMILAVIAEDPDSGEAYFQLALTQWEMEGKKKDALESIEKAIGCDPETATYHALRAIILASLGKGKQAHESADEAITLDPDLPLARLAKAEAFMEERKWKDAEAAVRAALELDPDNESAGNMLAHVQRLQNNPAGAGETVEQLLRENPENYYAHFNAGWAALQRGEPREAEKHFMEALRLKADFEPAREGLIESFKARSPLFRAYLSYCFFMQRFTGAAQWALIIGLLVGVRIGRALLDKVHPLAGVALAAVYLIFVLWVWLASGIGNLLILKDRTARMALTKPEKMEGAFVGGGLALGLLMALGGMATGAHGIAAAGGFLAAGSMPASLTFTNPNKGGQMLFGTLMAVCYASAILAFLTALVNGGGISNLAANLILPNVIIAMGCTWIGNIPALRTVRD